MFSIHPLLIFELDGALFGLDATLARESVWLPELTPVEEAPPWIAGLFSLRGQIIPVTDLNQRFGHPARPYSINDQVVVLELDGVTMGLIVNEVIEVIELPGDAIQPPPQFDAAAPSPAQLVAGEARVGDNLVALLDVARLALPLPSPPPRYAQGRELQPPPPLAGEGWGGGATPEARALFRERAKVLREAAAAEEGTRLGLAVVELDGEYFGVELQAVQEFCDIAQLSPIPCCPPHILGAMSLRGNLFTLLDVRAALNLPPGARGGKAVIARRGEQVVGVAVDAVHDVVYLRQEELQAAPALLCEQRGAEIKGTASYGDRMMAVLDLPALLAREEWIVNETV